MRLTIFDRRTCGSGSGELPIFSPPKPYGAAVLTFGVGQQMRNGIDEDYGSGPAVTWRVEEPAGSNVSTSARTIGPMHSINFPISAFGAGLTRGDVENTGVSTIYTGGGKRVFDLVVVLLTLPLTLPLILLGALALWIEGGNPFYQQARLGRGGKEFRLKKLRTMTRNAEAELAEILAKDPVLRHEWDTTQKLKKDPRITRVGQFLRSTSLDELTQIWNVLTGEMSIVGPRPMMPDQLELYGDPKAYFAMRPGLSGLWQIRERNNSHFSYRASVDRSYGATQSLWLDLSVLWQTIFVVLRRTGH